MKRGELIKDKRGVVWRNRIAQRKAGQFVFRCRRGHSEVSEWFVSKADAEEFRTRHDHDLHVGELESSIAATQRAKVSITISDAADELIDETEGWASKGKADVETVRDMRLNRDRLVAFFGEKQPIATVNRRRITAYIEHRLSSSITYNRKRDGSGGRTVRTSGARVLKEIRYFERLAKRGGLSHLLDWSPAMFEKRLKNDLMPKKQAVPPDVIEQFLDLLDGSAKAFVMLKVLTGGNRNEDLFELRVRDVDVVHGVLHYINHAKRRREWQSKPLAPELVPILLPLIEGRGPDDWLFTNQRGGQLKHGAFKGQFEKASKLVGIGDFLGLVNGKATGGVKWIRSSMITAVRQKSGSIDVASKLADHANVAVTERFYDLDREARDLKQQGVDVVRSLFSFSKRDKGSANGKNKAIGG